MGGNLTPMLVRKEFCFKAAGIMLDGCRGNLGALQSWIGAGDPVQRHSL